MFYGLQQWQVQPGGAMELHFSRWSGAPPIALQLDTNGVRLFGSATNQRKALSGFTTTLEGKRIRIFVYVDCLGCPAAPNGWSRMIGAPPKADGSYAVFLKTEWKGRRYRASIVGTAYAPDAETEIAAVQ